MKKIWVVLLLAAIIPAMAFADFQIGAVGMYKGDVSTINVSGITLNDFTFGGEARLTILDFIQGGVTALYYPGATSSDSASLLALADVGLKLDIAFLSLGLGVGPNATFYFNNPTAPVTAGANIKLAADANLGNFSVGLIGFYTLQDFGQLANVGAIFTKLPWVGLSVLYRF